MTDYVLKITSIPHNRHKNSGDIFLKNWEWKRWGISLILLLAGATANAAAFNFNGSAVDGCSLNAKTYTCASSPSTKADTIQINSKYTVIGNLVGASAVFSSDARLTGSLNVVGTVTMAASASVSGDLYAGETVTMAASASVGGNVTAGETVTMAAGVHVEGNVKGTTVSLAAKGVVKGSVSGTTVSLAEGGSIGGSILEATTVSLAANATVFGDVNATGTVSLAAKGCIRGNVWAATTVSLAASATIAGSVVAGTTFSLAHNASVGGTVTVTGKLLPPGIDTNGLGGSANCPANPGTGTPVTTITTTTTPPGGGPTTTTTESCVEGVNCGCIETPDIPCIPCVVGTNPLCTLGAGAGGGPRKSSWRQLK